MAGQAEVTKNMVTELLAGKHPSHLAVLMKTLSDPKVIDALVAAGQAHRVTSVITAKGSLPLPFAATA